MPAPSLSPFTNSTPSSSSRPGEKKEEFSIDWLKANRKEFDLFDKEKQNQIMGTLMYNWILKSDLVEESEIPKITGMLIDQEILELEEIIDILINDETMKERVAEAAEVIKDYVNQ